MKDLGFMNGWREDPPEYTKCREQKHNTTDNDVGPPHRGMDHRVTCQTCDLVWHYDSSD